MLCVKAGLSRSRLSLIESGYVIPAPEELERVNVALEQLIRAKALIDQVAASVGWPSSRNR